MGAYWHLSLVELLPRAAFDRECDAPWVVSGEAAEGEGGIVLSGEVGEVDRCLQGVVSRESDGVGGDEAPGNR